MAGNLAQLLLLAHGAATDCKRSDDGEARPLRVPDEQLASNSLAVSRGRPHQTAIELIPHTTSKSLISGDVMEESIENISAVQSLGASKKEIERFSDASEESYRRHRHTALFDALISMVWLRSSTEALLPSRKSAVEADFGKAAHPLGVA